MQSPRYPIDNLVRMETGGHWVALGLLGILLPCAAPLAMWGLWHAHQDSAQPLPLYDVSVDCSPCSRRDPPQLGPAEILDITLRPRTRVPRRVFVQAMLRYDSGIEPWPLAFARSSSGTFRLRAAVRSLPGLRPGVRQLIFVIDSPADPFGTWFLLAPPLTSSVVQVLTQPIDITS